MEGFFPPQNLLKPALSQLIQITASLKGPEKGLNQVDQERIVSRQGNPEAFIGQRFFHGDQFLLLFPAQFTGTTQAVKAAEFVIFPSASILEVWLRPYLPLSIPYPPASCGQQDPQCP